MKIFEDYSKQELVINGKRVQGRITKIEIDMVDDKVTTADKSKYSHLDHLVKCRQCQNVHQFNQRNALTQNGRGFSTCPNCGFWSTTSLA